MRWVHDHKRSMCIAQATNDVGAPVQARRVMSWILAHSICVGIITLTFQACISLGIREVSCLYSGLKLRIDTSLEPGTRTRPPLWTLSFLAPREKAVTHQIRTPGQLKRSSLCPIFEVSGRKALEPDYGSGCMNLPGK